MDENKQAIHGRGIIKENFGKIFDFSKKKKEVG